MHFFKRFPHLLAALLLLAPLSALAITGGAYADFSTTSLSTSGAPRFNGATIGGYGEDNLKGSFDFLNLGGDVRFSVEHASQSGVSFGYNTLLIGPEISFKTHITPLRPYAEVLFGGAYASANVSGGFTGYIPGVNDSASQKYGLISYIGGVDIKMFPHLAWRALELNYGKFNGVSSTTISTGLVLRLP